MPKTLLLILALAITAYSAEISPSYALLEKNAVFKPELKSEPVEMNTSQNEHKPDIAHPIYRAEETKNQGRARIEPVRSLSSIMQHEAMLSDQAGPSDVNTVDKYDNTGNGYLPGAEVAYPDIAYAPGYLYDTAYAAPNNYDTYLMQPDTSALGLLWSQVPDGRTLVSYTGRVIVWIINSIAAVFYGAIITVAICSYTDLCTFTFKGVGPIHEEMRQLMSPDRLEKISHAADFVKTAIDKYQKIQKVSDELPTMRRRRAIFNY